MFCLYGHIHKMTFQRWQKRENLSMYYQNIYTTYSVCSLKTILIERLRLFFFIQLNLPKKYSFKKTLNTYKYIPPCAAPLAWCYTFVQQYHQNSQKRANLSMYQQNVYTTYSVCSLKTILIRPFFFIASKFTHSMPKI